MSCERFGDDLVDLARGQDMDEGRRARAVAHADSCLRCAARLEDERAVSGALRAFAARTADAEAPPRVEAALRRALREPATAGTLGTLPAARSYGRTGWLVAAAAAVLMAILAGARVGRIGAPGAESPASVPGEGVAVPSPAALVPPSTTENQDFVALGEGEDLRELDSFQVVSVSLPRGALAALGWPEVGAAPSDPVRAEVIVGHDGVARAIRFVD